MTSSPTIDSESRRRKRVQRPGADDARDGGPGRDLVAPPAPVAESRPESGVRRAPAYARRAVVTPRVETILLATDLSAASSAATAQAVELASRLEARLLVVHVVGSPRPIGGFARSSRPETREERARAAQAVVLNARATGVDATFVLWDGDPGAGILAVAESESADLIVVGSHRRGAVGRYLLGSVSDYIVHHAVCAVLVVRPTEDQAEPDE